MTDSFVIETHDLTKTYGRTRGIVNVNLSVREGDCFGFIGPNGAGKSTTIRTLLGLIRPTSGSASVLGMDVVRQKTDILAKVGYLPAEGSFWRGMTVGELIRFSAGLRGLDCAAEAKRLTDALALDTGMRVERLSLGNRKKVGIVCALQHRPPLYILDEPTSGLDPLMQHVFYDLLAERRREGATIFLSSHVLPEVGRFCTTAAVIREGRLLVCDSVDKLAHTGVKRVTLRGVGGSVSVPGADSVRYENDTLTFLWNGGAEALVGVLSGLRFADLTVTDPDFDEIFMRYYAKEAD